eukprot:SAG22_NODE_3770_length_1536_cov_2.702157_2_plen_165_part_00
MHSAAHAVPRPTRTRSRRAQPDDGGLRMSALAAQRPPSAGHGLPGAAATGSRPDDTVRPGPPPKPGPNSTKVSARLNAAVLFPAACRRSLASGSGTAELEGCARVLASYLGALLGPKDLLALFTATGCTRYPPGHRARVAARPPPVAARPRQGVQGAVWTAGED